MPANRSAAEVLDLAEASVHRASARRDHPAEHVAEALVAEADAEHGDLAEAQDVRADAEVVPALRAARTRREHDRVEVPARQRAPGDHVVVNHDRLLAGDGGEQVKDVVCVGVVVVDQQRAHRLRLQAEACGRRRQTLSELSPRPRPVRSASQYQRARCAQVAGQRPDVEAIDGEAQIAAVELRLDDREAVVGIGGGSPAGASTAVCRARARGEVPAEALALLEQLRGIEVDARRTRVRAGSSRARSAPRSARARDAAAHFAPARDRRRSLRQATR